MNYQYARYDDDNTKYYANQDIQTNTNILEDSSQNSEAALNRFSLERVFWKYAASLQHPCEV